ncbi:MAG: PEP-CTERM sorting domain-containing protein [Sedimentisphaerales bacterium]|nr:PEP-CTERM sorting domain-containing protein [Sedimentisphaerales bacterium]
MKVDSPAHVGFSGVIFIFLIVVGCTFTSAYCQSQKMTLLVQQTPNEGGEVTPLAGTYKYDQDSEITLTATPNAGYEFLYWLGDVSEKESISTVVHLDKPKIVIAVFEKTPSNLDTSSHVGGGGGGGLISNHVNIGNSVSISGGGGKSQKPIVYAPSGDKTPVIPEPATGLLLAIGSLFTFTKRRRRQINPSQN